MAKQLLKIVDGNRGRFFNPDQAVSFEQNGERVHVTFSNGEVVEISGNVEDVLEFCYGKAIGDA